QFILFFINFLAFFQACVLAAPSLQRRGQYSASSPCHLAHRFCIVANLAISLRQTQPNTANWHFALVTHAPGVTTGTSLAIEHVIDAGAKLVHTVFILLP